MTSRSFIYACVLVLLEPTYRSQQEAQMTLEDSQAFDAKTEFMRDNSARIFKPREDDWALLHRLNRQH